MTVGTGGESMSRKPLKGVFPLMPLVLKRSGALDLQGLKSNIEAYEEVGFQGYIALGCMGEFYATSEKDFNKIVESAVKATRKIACVFGTTFHNTKECLRRTRYAEDAGADGAMIGLPYLIPCTYDAAFEHYKQINDGVDEIQIMAYNNPFSFRFNMTTEFWDKLMELDRVKAVKESNHDVAQRTKVVSHISKRINVFPGGEQWLLGDSLLGANGLVSLAGAGVPKATLAYFDACTKRDLGRAIPFHIKFTETFGDMNAENEVAWLKALAELGGLKAGPPRAPYAPLPETLRKKLTTFIRELNAMV